ncbi:nucleoside hydrolase [Nocardia mexicana]|uniref:Inosine-uridine nucleoside N-ribohydrolase n=1 Tax=Nocardia mexicana TaxID=279262 RepID=A0A370GIE0_9NOCA|nr:nucleoside hydrolase [Nocardia mexicana]RDI43552.1 inosine-uridine nucleoside N-ribohydrolase [Nocardia mexicana]
MNDTPEPVTLTVPADRVRAGDLLHGLDAAAPMWDLPRRVIGKPVPMTLVELEHTGDDDGLVERSRRSYMVTLASADLPDDEVETLTGSHVRVTRAAIGEPFPVTGYEFPDLSAADTASAATGGPAALGLQPDLGRRHTTARHRRVPDHGARASRNDQRRAGRRVPHQRAGSTVHLRWHDATPGNRASRRSGTCHHNRPVGQTPEAAHEAALEIADRYPEFARQAARPRLGGPPLPTLTRTPIILDVDAGGDPDDAIAVRCAALLPELALVVTSDEIGGERARFVRHLLDLLGRTDVPVVAGADLGNRKYWVVDGLTPSTVAAQPTDVPAAVRALAARTDGRIRWVGCGPMTNLADTLRTAPELRERLMITQMGGAINYRDPDRAEHNVRLDPTAARYVIATAHDLTLVPSDVTFTDKIALYPGHPIYQQLTAPDAGEWARLLAVHLDRWAAAFGGRTSKQHDPMTLTVASCWGLPTWHCGVLSSPMTAACVSTPRAAGS